MKHVLGKETVSEKSVNLIVGQTWVIGTEPFCRDMVSLDSPSSLRLADLPMEARGSHTTRWTAVLTANGKQGTETREALASLCATCWYQLYAFIRRRGSSPQEAEDLRQEFFRRFLERNALARVLPAAGKFRSFLLAGSMMSPCKVLPFFLW